jgi:hypothetical protein
MSFSAGLFQHRAKRSKKVFWFFFSKKNFLPSRPFLPRHAPGMNSV